MFYGRVRVTVSSFLFDSLLPKKDFVLKNSNSYKNVSL
nr:MAG TPA: hypothetical protein [Caudoviricetes sp.]